MKLSIIYVKAILEYIALFIYLSIFVRENIAE